MRNYTRWLKPVISISDDALRGIGDRKILRVKDICFHWNVNPAVARAVMKDSGCCWKTGKQLYVYKDEFLEFLKASAAKQTGRRED